MMATSRSSKLRRPSCLALTGPPAPIPSSPAQENLTAARSAAIAEGRTAAAQTIGGTGAVRLVADFIKTHLPEGTTVYIPDPTWGSSSTESN